jgi:hypothetical protein
MDEVVVTFRKGQYRVDSRNNVFRKARDGSETPVKGITTISRVRSLAHSVRYPPDPNAPRTWRQGAHIMSDEEIEIWTENVARRIDWTKLS